MVAIFPGGDELINTWQQDAIYSLITLQCGQFTPKYEGNPCLAREGEVRGSFVRSNPIIYFAPIAVCKLVVYSAAL